MSQPSTPIVVLPPQTAPDWANPWSHPELFQGVTLKRIMAYLVDLTLVTVLVALVWFASGVLVMLSLGLLLPVQALLVAAVPFAYHILTIAGPRSATLGMRLMGLRVRRMEPLPFDGDGRPTLVQAMILTVTFYGSVAMTGSLVLLVVLFNARRRALHDWLAGTVVVNAAGPGSATSV